MPTSSAALIPVDCRADSLDDRLYIQFSRSWTKLPPSSYVAIGDECLKVKMPTLNVTSTGAIDRSRMSLDFCLQQGRIPIYIFDAFHLA
jgi:hypothetical protein